MKKILVTAAAFGLMAGSVATAHATNGYFSHGYSIKSKGMAGAGVAAPLDAMAPASNPAGLTEVGNRLDVGVVLFNPNREFTVDRLPNALPPGPPNQDFFPLVGAESDSNYFAIPNIGWSKQLNNNGAIGIAMYGNGGMNTDYPTNPIYGNVFYDPISSSTGVDLMQLFITPTYAHKFADKHSFGITPIIAAQFFEARGLIGFGAPPPGGFGVSANPANLTNNGHDTAFGFGARVGYLGKLTDKFNVGISFQSKIYMDEFDDYAGLFAEQGDFDIPANWTVGFAVMPVPAVTIAFDVQHIYYSEVNSVGNPMLPNLGAPGAGTGLGPDNGAGFGWDDMTVYKIGLQWARNEKWTYRFGYSYGEQPIQGSTTNPFANQVLFNILAPAVIEQHATFGLTYTFDNGSELDFSLMYAFENDVTGMNPFADGGPDYNPSTPDGTNPQNITLTMDQWEFGIGYSWKF